MMEPTVRVMPNPNCNALGMFWGRTVHRDDIELAYKHITSYLNKQTRPVFIIVDFQNDPLIPLWPTITGAIYGPASHPMLAGWLMVGLSSQARNIARMVTSLTRRDNVLWFQTIEQAEQYAAVQAMKSEPLAD